MGRYLELIKFLKKEIPGNTGKLKEEMIEAIKVFESIETFRMPRLRGLNFVTDIIPPKLLKSFVFSEVIKTRKNYYQIKKKHKIIFGPEIMVEIINVFQGKECKFPEDAISGYKIMKPMHDTKIQREFGNSAPLEALEFLSFLCAFALGQIDNFLIEDLVNVFHILLPSERTVVVFGRFHEDEHENYWYFDLQTLDSDNHEWGKNTIIFYPAVKTSPIFKIKTA